MCGLAGGNHITNPTLPPSGHNRRLALSSGWVHRRAGRGASGHADQVEQLLNWERIRLDRLPALDREKSVSTKLLRILKALTQHANENAATSLFLWQLLDLARPPIVEDLRMDRDCVQLNFIVTSSKSMVYQLLSCQSLHTMASPVQLCRATSL